MGQQQVDAGSLETGWTSVLFVQLAAALTETTVDQDALAYTFDQIT